MTTSVLDLFTESSRIMGERIGTMGTVTVGGSTTTVILNGLVGTTGDNTSYAGWRLIFVSTTGSLGEAMVTTWTDVTGTATIPNQTLAPVAAGTYILVAREDYTLNEYRVALNVALNRTPRTYRQVIPLYPLLRVYPLSMCDWLKGAEDVDAVYFTLSPLMLHNEDFSLWQNGTTSAPDGYALSGSGATVTRTAGGIRSAYAATVTAAGATAQLTNTIPNQLDQWLTLRSFPVLTPIRAAAWVYTTDANSVRVFINYTEGASGSPVSTTVYSDYVTANGIQQYPSVNLTPTATMKGFSWGIEVAANKTAVVSWAGMMQNTQTFDNSFQIHDSGSQALPYNEYSRQHVVRNVGGIPTVELGDYANSYGQVVAYVRRPFPAYAADTDTYDDRYKRVLVAGLINFMLEAYKSEQARQRLDPIRQAQATIWTRLVDDIVDLPVPAPPVRREVGGA